MSQTTSKPRKKSKAGKAAAKSAHLCHDANLPALKKIQGQIGGIQQMIEEGRYCVDILIQCRAAMAALRSVELKIFQRHLTHCVEDTFKSKDVDEMRRKAEELTALLIKRTHI